MPNPTTAVVNRECPTCHAASEWFCLHCYGCGEAWADMQLRGYSADGACDLCGGIPAINLPILRSCEPAEMWRPAVDERLAYAGWHDRNGGHCRLRFWPAHRVAVVTEVPSNPGPSITNVADNVARAVAERCGTGGVTLVEHYDDRSYGHGTPGKLRLAVVTVDDAGLVSWAPPGAELAWVAGVCRRP